jgi:hypothetical protein
VLRGDLAAFLSFAAGKKEARPPFGGRAAWQFNIAGIGGCGDMQPSQIDISGGRLSDNR